MGRTRARRGQVIMVVGLVIAIMIISVASTLYYTSVVYGTFRMQPVQEVSQNLTSDFYRVATGALANITAHYSSAETAADLTTMDIIAYNWTSFWQRAAILTYATHGISLRYSPSGGPIPAMNRSIAVVYLNGTTTQIKLNSSSITLATLPITGTFLDWGTASGVSMMNYSFGLSLNSMGLSNYSTSVLVSLNLTILSLDDSSQPGETLLNATVLGELGSPVLGLNNSSFVAYYVDPSTKGEVRANIIGSQDLDGGSYTLKLQNATNGQIPDGGLAYIILQVRDQRGIVVGASTYRAFPVYGQDNLTLSSGGGSPPAGYLSSNPSGLNSLTNLTFDKTSNSHEYLEFVPFLKTSNATGTGISPVPNTPYPSAAPVGWFNNSYPYEVKPGGQVVVTIPYSTSSSFSKTPQLLAYLFSVGAGGGLIGSGSSADLVSGSGTATVTFTIGGSPPSLAGRALDLELWLYVPNGGNSGSYYVNLKLGQATSNIKMEIILYVIPLIFYQWPN